MSVERHPLAAPFMPGRDLSYWVAGICLALGALLLGLLFQREIRGAVDVWLGSTAYNHCFLIIPVAAYMGWDRRGTLTGLRPNPEPRILPAIVALSLLWLVAASIGILELRQFVVLAMFQLIAVGVLGWPLYRALLAPFLYLFLLVPSGAFLVPWLQDLTAHFAVIGLQLAGVPVYADGTVIEIPAGTFVVAEACAGLRFLVASLAFGIFYAVLMYRGQARRLVFIGLSLIVPIVANWCRAFGIIYLAELTGSAEAVEADHVIYGWGFFTAVTILLILIGNTFSDGARRHAEHPQPDDGTPYRPTPNWRIIAVAALGILLSAAGPGYAAFLEEHAATMPLANSLPPAVSSPWRLLANPEQDWQPLIVGADRTFQRTYTDGTDRVTLYLALYQRRGVTNNLVRAQNRMADPEKWRRSGSHTARITIGDQDATIGVTEFQNQARHLLLWHFYIVDGHIVPSALSAKLSQTRDFFLGGDKISAFVAVAADSDENGAVPHNALQRFLKAVEPLPHYLHRLAGKH